MSETGEISHNPIESQERLHPPNKIFFHATPSQNVPSLVQHGLVSIHNRDILGKDLLYSVTFGKEFNLRYRIKRDINPQGNVSKFSLTVWADSSDIKQVKKYGELVKGQYGPSQKLLLDEEIPEGFLESNMGGKNVDITQLRKVNPSNFLAAIPINKDLGEVLALCKLQMTARSRKVEDMQNILADFFKAGSSGITLRPGYTADDLSRDLLFRMQQEALLYQTGPMVKEVIDNLKEPSIKSSLLKTSIAELKAKQQAVNDPVGNRYLNILERKLRQALEQRGLGNQYDQTEPARVTSIPLVSNSVDPYQLWGGVDGYNLAKQVAKDIKINI